MAGGGRHRARRSALEALYTAEVNGQALGEAAHGLDGYAATLVSGVATSTEALDAAISDYLREDWPLDRLGAVERAVLRIGTFELQGDDVPDEVAIDEAVELARRYASGAAARLINGVLAAMHRGRGNEST